MFSLVSVCPRGSPGLCPGGFLVSVQGEGSLSRGVCVWGVSVQGWSLSKGPLSRGLCLGWSLSGGGVSVQGSCFCPRGVSAWGSLCRERGLCPGGSLSEGSLSRGVSVQIGRGLCLGDSHSGVLCPGVSVWGSLSGGSLSRGSPSRLRGVSVQIGRWSLCLEGLCHGDLRMITSGRYASYWNAFLSKGISIWYQGTLFNEILAYTHIFAHKCSCLFSYLCPI